MDTLSLPTNAAQAQKFMSNGSLSFPNGAPLPGQQAPQGLQQPQPQFDGVHGQDEKMMVAATPGAISSASGIVPTLQNIVATVNLDCRLDLKTIALHARNAEYNPKRFAAVIMRIREPKTTALIFASGKMVVTGAKSEDDSKLASRKYARIIQKLGFNAKFTDFKIQNIVGSCDVKFPIRLEGLAYSHGTFSSYEPELFPGLIYRMVKPKIVLLIFRSTRHSRLSTPCLPNSGSHKWVSLLLVVVESRVECGRPFFVPQVLDVRGEHSDHLQLLASVSSLWLLLSAGVLGAFVGFYYWRLLFRVYYGWVLVSLICQNTKKTEEVHQESFDSLVVREKDVTIKDNFAAGSGGLCAA
ncbi:hypothetical protein G7K_1916-t1 [Saitoella complicata NRRL Y-17804]|uniref:TATA-box-binding protein n=1 Tax=Saitoella complicata (strain BCRC 22490 / CBS 7301 / JCM 7358 / NBRC 10748 / NRRL Y-17804) TaxID=698492 RepID=A0A0E9NCY1_SAICN|nr:hypothetical protein G7K_1916-t1 [Saitoella complicata NRRL Y-17804]